MSRPAQPAAQSPKAAHYNANLGAALTRGSWADSNPGAAPNGATLSWSELLRKWGKHTGGTVALVQALRNVSLLDLSSKNPRTQIRSPDSSGDGFSHDTTASGSASSYIHISRSETQTASNAAAAPPRADKRTTAGDADGEDGASSGAWAVGGLWGRALSGSHLEEVREGIRSLEGMLAASSLQAAERPSAALTTAYSLYSLGDHDAALAAYDRFDWSLPPTMGVVEGDAAVTERIRGRTIQGICCELSSQPDQAMALQYYLDTVALLSKLALSPSMTPAYLSPSTSSRTNTASFDNQREVMRSVSTALTRAAVISARTPNEQQTLRILRTYQALSANWPASFRANQRQRMLSLYLSALYAAYPAAGVPAPEPYLLAGGSSGRSARSTWRAEVVEGLRNGQNMLKGSTAFPRAGQVNHPVIELAERAASLASQAPVLAGEVISVLWWATSLTFHSHSILRHLTRLLATVGDAPDARRTFELYVQLVLKSRQTEDPESTLKLERSPTGTELDGLGTEATAGDTSGDDEAIMGTIPKAQPEGEADSDDDFITALLVGTHLLLTDLNEPREAWRYITLAGDVIKQQRHPRPSLMSKVEEAKGIVRMAMSTSVADRVKRPRYQAQAINHAKAATVLNPESAEAFYHLAYCHTVARAIDPATDAVRSALELDSQSVRAWHLLALLLTACGDWTGAAKAGEAGVALWEADDESASIEEADTISGEIPEPNAPHSLLLPTGELTPPTPAPPQRPDASRRLESVIQLRMTLNVVAEKLHGPEVALARQQELFGFFSRRTENSSRARSRTTSTRDPSGRGSERSTGHGDLGGSYVLTPPADTAMTSASPAPAAPQTLTAPIISTTASSSPGGSTATSEAEGEREQRRVAFMHKKSLLPKHLHVPSVVRGHQGQQLRAASAPSALRRLGASASESHLPLGTQRNRTASTSTIALSIAPTAVHSHYHGVSRAAPPPPPPTKRGPPRSPREERILSDLWLMSAASFRRSGQLEQALVAIEEAETRDPENPAVWVQLGLFHIACDDSATDCNSGLVLSSFTKALLLRPDYPSAIVSLGRLYLSKGDLDLAHSLLLQLTEDRGWDVPEAWFTLAKICERQSRVQRAQECLLYALQLERSRPCRAVGDALERW